MAKHEATPPALALTLFRQASDLFPFKPQFRIVAALYMIRRYYTVQDVSLEATRETVEKALKTLPNYGYLLTHMERLRQ